MFLKCIFKSLTGYDCPFCGAQRAFHSLMEGDIAAAFGYNPFLFVMMPYIASVILCIFGIIPEHSRFNRIIYNKWVITAVAAAVIIWTIVRNTLN